MAERVSTYSQIITPEDYNRIMNDEHLYIADSDIIVKQLVDEEIKKNGAKEIVEIGCGPGRLLIKIAKIKGINLTAIDHDPAFINHCKNIINNKQVNLILADITNYKHANKVDVFYSQGVHHHISKNEDLQKYLKNVYDNLKINGVYIVSDEFLAEYKNEKQRKIKAILWYSHIIGNAQKSGFNYLAQEEAKTLIDDLDEEKNNKNIKTREQIDLVLNYAPKISTINFENVEVIAKEFLSKLNIRLNVKKHGDPTLDLSRVDYKICDSVFRKDVESFGFKIEKLKTLGPVTNLGGFGIYLLRK